MFANFTVLHFSDCLRILQNYFQFSQKTLIIVICDGPKYIPALIIVCVNRHMSIYLRWCSRNLAKLKAWFLFLHSQDFL